MIGATWIINLGNRKFLINLVECKNIKRVTYKYMIKTIHFPLSKKYTIDKVDYWYQILGYILIVFGLILSTVLFFLQNNSGNTVNWLALDNIYSLIDILYLFVLVVFGASVRIILYLKDYLWYKKSKHL